MESPTNLDKHEIVFGRISLQVSKNVGPRILSLSYQGSDNIFAELPYEYLKYPGVINWYFYGGHRLWIAPENPEITYIPDNEPVEFIHSQKSVKLVQNPINSIGIQKTIQIKSTAYDNILIIDHFLHNIGDSSFVCAPWAITQFKLGGVAIIPLCNRKIEGKLLLPDRSIVLWPYTDIQDQRIEWSNDYIHIDSRIEKEPLKIGIPNSQEWIAYYINDLLFVKYAKSHLSTNYLDNGATSEVYCNSKFLELETLGLLKKIRPGSFVKHREVWRMITNPHDFNSVKNISRYFDHDKENDICKELIK